MQAILKIVHHLQYLIGLVIYLQLRSIFFVSMTSTEARNQEYHYMDHDFCITLKFKCILKACFRVWHLHRNIMAGYWWNVKMDMNSSHCFRILAITVQ